MDDAEECNIRIAVSKVLPDMPVAVLNIVEETLQSLGVQTMEDFQFVQESDLMSVLRPIQARKLVAAWKQMFENNESSSLSPSPASSQHSSLSPSPRCAVAQADWVDSFEIPVEKFPEDLKQCLVRKRRPSPRLRKEMIRIVVAAMMKACPSPNKQASTQVAKKLLSLYPDSLQDVIEGDVVGSGYHSIVKQLQTRIENVKRSFSPKLVKRKQRSDDYDTEEIPADKKAAMQDTYGCIKWDVRFLPLSETPESQEEKKDTMKILSKQANINVEKVKSLLKCTYYSQRKDINKGAHLTFLTEEWPFLFEEVGLSLHFQELTGIALMDTFLASVDKKGKRLLDFMRTVCAEKSKRIVEVLTKCSIMKGQLEGSSGDLKDMILLLLSYFDEKEESLFCYVDDTCLRNEVPTHMPVTPCIIVCGPSCYAAKNFMLTIDRQVVNDHISSFISALCLMFGSYYCLNIHYPVELGSTLEFLQRCFFNINPEKGTKVETKTNKKRLNVNPRVLTLIADLSDHEWRGTF